MVPGKFENMHLALETVNSEISVVPVKISQSSWIFQFHRFILFYGRVIFVLPFSMEKIKNGEYNLRTGLYRKGVYILIQLFLIFHVCYRFIQMEYKSDDIHIMKWIWTSTFLLLIVYDSTIFYYCGWKCNTTWINIMKLGEKIEAKFMQISVNIRSPSDDIFGLGFSVVSFLMGLLHILALRSIPEYDGTKQNDDGDLKFIPFTARSLDSLDLKNEWCKSILSFVIPIPDVLVWGIWHYGDALRITTAFVVRKLYGCLNQYLNNASKAEIKRNFGIVIQIHQSITQLVNLLNEILALMTLISVILIVMYTSYYANFIMFGFGGTLRRICFIGFSVRTTVMMWLAADVNTKAHAVTTYLGKLSAESDTFPQSDPSKFIIFTSQVYNEDIGFKGLHFFTMSTSFIGKVVSILISYTVIIIQFAKQ